MDRIHHTLRLSGGEPYGREAPPIPVGTALRLIGPAVQEAIRMGFQGRSRARGRVPTWLANASDIRFVDIDGASGGDTALHFEAPRLGEAAEELYRQQELWSTRPPADDTGFDLLGDVIGDVAARREDSDRFDSPLLKRLAGFAKVLDRVYQRAALIGHRFPEDHPAIVDAETITGARALAGETPGPQSFRVVGALDMVRVSSQNFELLLDDGTRAPGVLVDGDMADVARLANTRVFVDGKAVYRPSGRLLRLDARRIEPSQGAPGLWSALPGPRPRGLDPRQYRRPQAPGAGVAAFYGTWPGGESDKEWDDLIESLD